MYHHVLIMTAGGNGVRIESAGVASKFVIQLKDICIIFNHIVLRNRRWKKLFPNEVPLLQEARKIQKAALISNFVDRESERPALGPTDFRPVPNTVLLCNTDDPKPAPKRNVKTRLILILSLFTYLSSTIER